MKPDVSHLSDNYKEYLNLIEEDNISGALSNHTGEAIRFFESISEAQSELKYADDKWTVKEVLQHVTDAERIFNYRALAIARGDKNSLPSFDENAYAAHARANRRTWKSLTEEFGLVRSSTIALAGSFSSDELKTTGIVGGNPISVLAILYISIGHVTHHINIIKTRYLV